MLKKEWKSIFRNPKLAISIFGILLIPLMYAGMFIWAFYDPYGNVEKLPIAVVNNDDGSIFHEEKITLGDDLVDNLKENEELNFTFVEHETGYQQLEEQEYYLLVEIPENFSENATSVLDDQPEKLELIYVPNEGYNFLASQIGSTVLQEMQIAIQEEVTETYTNTMMESITKMADGFQSSEEAAYNLDAGAEEISENTETLKNGLYEFSSHQNTLSASANDLTSGSSALQTGISSLSDGLGQLTEAQHALMDGANEVESGSSNLKDGIQQVGDGISTASDTMMEITSGTSQLIEGTESLTSGLVELREGATATEQGAADLQAGIAVLNEQLAPVMNMLPEENQQALNEALGQLSTGSEALAEGNRELASAADELSSASPELTNRLTTLNEGQQALQNGLAELDSGTVELENGADQLQQGQQELTAGFETFSTSLNEAKTGSDDLLTGTESLADGATQFDEATNELADGSDKLARGSEELENGTKELKDGTEKFHQELEQAATDSQEAAPTDETANMVASPVEMNKNEINAVPNYGTGFTPYFLSLGLFVGALALTVIYPLRDPVEKPRSGFSWFISKSSVLASVAIIQAILASIIVLYVLKIEVESVPLFFLFAVITSLSFMAMIQFLVTTMDNPGRYIVIILMILQLTTSAGTFPLELIPEALHWLNQLLPMTYSVSGLKEVISTGNFNLMWSNAFVLLGFMIFFLALTLLYFVIRYKVKYRPAKEAGAQ